MAPASDDEGQRSSSPPLWSIGVAVASMLIVPLVLYSIAPTGPLREGDTVFSNGAQTVQLMSPAEYRDGPFKGSCVLDSGDPLLVLHHPAEGPDGTILAKVQGKTSVEFPFCPPQGEVRLKSHQFLQKPEFFTDLRDRLSRLR